MSCEQAGPVGCDKRVTCDELIQVPVTWAARGEPTSRASGWAGFFGREGTPGICPGRPRCAGRGPRRRTRPGAPSLNHRNSARIGLGRVECPGVGLAGMTGRDYLKSLAGTSPGSGAGPGSWIGPGRGWPVLAPGTITGSGFPDFPKSRPNRESGQNPEYFPDPRRGPAHWQIRLFSGIFPNRGGGAGIGDFGACQWKPASGSLPVSPRVNTMVPARCAAAGPSE